MRTTNVVPFPLVSAGPAHLEAAGALTGKQQDPTAGLPSRLDTAGRRWVQYGGEWLLTHTLAKGDTLGDTSRGQRALTIVYYGSITRDGVQRIGGHPLNVEVLGPQYASGYPGDVIVIPGAGVPSWPAAPVVPDVPAVPVVNPPAPTPGPETPKAPWSTGMKVAAGGVVLAALAAAAYFLSKSKRRKRK